MYYNYVIKLFANGEVHLQMQKYTCKWRSTFANRKVHATYLKVHDANAKVHATYSKVHMQMDKYMANFKKKNATCAKIDVT